MLFGFNDDDFDDDVYYEPDDSKGGGYDPDHDDGYNGRFSGRERGRSAMQSASMILAVLCIISSMFIYISLPLGAVAIVLALLSRGERKTLGKAKTAVTVAAAGMLASSAITGYAFWRVTTDPVLRRQLQQMVEYYSGAYLGQSASEAFPWLFEKDEGETLRRYSIFCAVTRRVSIARPMDILGDPLPQALARLEGAKDLWCSVENSAPGLTQVRPGERVNYRVTVRNQGEQRRLVTVTFSPPAGTVLCRKDRTEQTLEGGEEAHFLFAAEVNADYSTDWIDGPKVTVNGLEIYAHRVLVGTTLSEKEAEALSREVREKAEGGMTALAAAAQAYGARGIRMEENESRWCFTHFCFHDSTKGDVLSRRPQRPKTDLAVYSGFGGKGVITPEMGSADGMRAILIRRRDLMPGDVVLCWEDSFGNQGCSAYYDGNALIGRFEAGEETKILTGEQIDAFLDTLFGRFAFLILRPWQGR